MSDRHPCGMPDENRKHGHCCCICVAFFQNCPRRSDQSRRPPENAAKHSRETDSNQNTNDARYVAKPLRSGFLFSCFWSELLGFRLSGNWWRTADDFRQLDDLSDPLPILKCFCPYQNTLCVGSQ